MYACTKHSSTCTRFFVCFYFGFAIAATKPTSGQHEWELMKMRSLYVQWDMGQWEIRGIDSRGHCGLGALGVAAYRPWHGILPVNAFHQSGSHDAVCADGPDGFGRSLGFSLATFAHPANSVCHRGHAWPSMPMPMPVPFTDQLLFVHRGCGWLLLWNIFDRWTNRWMGLVVWELCLACDCSDKRKQDFLLCVALGSLSYDVISFFIHSIVCRGSAIWQCCRDIKAFAGRNLISAKPSLWAC